MKPGTIYFLERDHWLVLKLVGSIRVASRESCRLSAALECFVQTLPERAELQRIVIDLTETTAIDSTNLGLLAQIARFASAHLQRPPTLVSPNEDINTLLESVGFDQVFLIARDAAMPQDKWELLAGVAAPPSEQSRMILEAHRALAELNPNNHEKFHDVIELLDRELGGQDSLENHRQ